MDTQRKPKGDTKNTRNPSVDSKLKGNQPEGLESFLSLLSRWAENQTFQKRNELTNQLEPLGAAAWLNGKIHMVQLRMRLFKHRLLQRKGLKYKGCIMLHIYVYAMILGVSYHLSSPHASPASC